MAEILALVLQHDEQAVLCAVELALDAGVPTKTHVLNLLHRLIDDKTTGRNKARAAGYRHRARIPMDSGVDWQEYGRRARSSHLSRQTDFCPRLV